MVPFQSPSVFNFYKPEYSPPGMVSEGWCVAPDLPLTAKGCRLAHPLQAARKPDDEPWRPVRVRARRGVRHQGPLPQAEGVCRLRVARRRHPLSRLAPRGAAARYGEIWGDVGRYGSLHEVQPQRADASRDVHDTPATHPRHAHDTRPRHARDRCCCSAPTPSERAVSGGGPRPSAVRWRWRWRRRGVGRSGGGRTSARTSPTAVSSCACTCRRARCRL